MTRLLRRNIMVVGQTPPPWHGQAIAIKELIETNIDGINLEYVPVRFSRDIDEVGHFQWAKLPRLLSLVANVWRTRFTRNCDVLYYPPGGLGIVAVVKDVIVLLSCRMLFKRVVFHSHAGGFTEVAEATPLPIRVLARLAYRRPDLLIQLTEASPPDGAHTKAKEIVYVPYGIPDNGARYTSKFREGDDIGIRILFVGAVRATKGVMVLLEACARLKEKRIAFKLRVVGDFNSAEFEADCKSFIDEHNLADCVEFAGVLTGDDKWQTYCKSDIFCFPSYYPAENQPLVILEAMQFALPTVATDWRSIPTMVANGETGYVVPTNDSVAVAERISLLIQNPELRARMGSAARKVFLERYTDAVWRPAMGLALGKVF